MVVANIIEKVVVLIPPPVPLGQPPINISAQIKVFVKLVKLFKFKVKKPFERAEMEWKKEVKMLSKRFEFARLFSISKTKKIKLPRTIKIVVEHKASLEWIERNFSFLCCFFNSIISCITIKPSPPAIVNMLTIVNEK